MVLASVGLLNVNIDAIRVMQEKLGCSGANN